MANEFTGEAFLEALADGSLTEPLIRVGMVKLQADSSDEFLFSEGGCGSEWIAVPVNLVEKATFVRMLPCEDHQHPLVVIEFKAPPKGDSAAALFAKLARSQAGTPLASIMGGLGAAQDSPGGAMSPAGTMPCGPAGMPCGGVGAPCQEAAVALARSAIGGGGGGIRCIAWHTECRTITIWISSLNFGIPVRVCYRVCDTIAW